MDTITTPATAVWTNNTSGSAYFHPLTDALSSAAVKKARVSTELRLASHSVLRVQAYYEWSTDGLTWANPTTIGEVVDPTDEIDTGSLGFETISLTNSKRFLRFGAKLWNDTGTDLNLGYVALRIELRSS